MKKSRCYGLLTLIIGVMIASFVVSIDAKENPEESFIRSMVSNQSASINQLKQKQEILIVRDLYNSQEQIRWYLKEGWIIDKIGCQSINNNEKTLSQGSVIIVFLK